MYLSAALTENGSSRSTITMNSPCGNSRFACSSLRLLLSEVGVHPLVDGEDLGAFDSFPQDVLSGFFHLGSDGRPGVNIGNVSLVDPAEGRASLHRNPSVGLCAVDQMDRPRPLCRIVVEQPAHHDTRNQRRRRHDPEGLRLEVHDLYGLMPRQGQDFSRANDPEAKGPVDGAILQDLEGHPR